MKAARSDYTEHPFFYKERNWTEYRFVAWNKDNLIALILKYDKWFFSDSIFEFCCREPDVRGYFAYDEHGTFFIYNKKEKEGLIKSGLLSSKKKELLSDKPHWHHRPKDAEITLMNFKAELKKNSEFYDDEADQTAPSERE